MPAILSLISPRLWWALGGVALAVAAYFGHEHLASSAKQQAVEEALREVRQAAREEYLKAQAEVQAERTAAFMAKWENERESNERARVLEGDIDRLRNVNLGMQRTLAALRGDQGGGGQGAGPLSIIDAGPALASALGQCVSRYSGVAEVADRLSAQVSELQGYITRVVGPVCISGYEKSADAGAPDEAEKHLTASPEGP